MSPMMDMTAALTNPYTLDVCDILRRALSEDTYGEGETSNTLLPGVRAVIYPMDADLDRAPEAGRVAGRIVIISRTTIYGQSGPSNAAGTAFMPDLITWNGNQYTVTLVEDYSQYGRGFTKATCALVARSPLPGVDKP